MSEKQIFDHLRARLREYDPKRPLAVLGLSQEATREEIRRAFLEAVKVYHPHRFVRCSGDVQRLANDLFILMSKARRAGTPAGFRARGTRPGTSIAPASPPARSARRATISRAPEPADPRTQRFHEARVLLDQGRFAEALIILQGLAGEHPADQVFQVYLLFCRGRQKQAIGRSQEAELEYRRALNIDRQFTPARRALQELPEATGLFGRVPRR